VVSNISLEGGDDLSASSSAGGIGVGRGRFR
jgi:hypothetical protein